jgi:hypothetical protein
MECAAPSFIANGPAFDRPFALYLVVAFASLL